MLLLYRGLWRCVALSVTLLYKNKNCVCCIYIDIYTIRCTLQHTLNLVEIDVQVFNLAVLYDDIVWHIRQTQAVEEVAVYHSAVADSGDVLGIVLLKSALTRTLVGVKADAYNLKLAVKLTFSVSQLAQL